MPRRNGKSRSQSSGHVFSRAPQMRMPRSKFSRSHGIKTTFNAGAIVPIFTDEMLPGDTFSLKLHAFARMATPIYPIMDNLFLETFFFFVPNRLLWEHWEAFNGARTGPSDATTADTYTVPTITSLAGVTEASLGDYFGLPTQVAGLQFNSLHHRAYNLIYNEWFKDENLIDDVVVDTDDGPDFEGDYVLLSRGKRHDYFTSSLPWPQKNADGAISLPLGVSAPVVGNSSNVVTEILHAGGGNTATLGWDPSDNIVANNPSSTPGGVANIVFSGTTSLSADLTDATAATINDIRLAFQTQKLYENDARGGTRYTEIIRSHFGVESPDSRLQRPEYLGGGSTPIQVVPVAQTAPTAGPNALGDLAAYAVAAPKGHGFTYSATEHGVVLGFVNVRADLNYQQGLDRMWSRQTRLDFYWPAFAHLGEQAVLNKEIFAAGTAADDNVFGYQERFAEYRYKPSLITGAFRSNAAVSLDPWHLAQDFAALPLLNAAFITENPPMDRILAVPAEPDFLFDGQFSYNCVRPMPVYSVPGLVDHF